MIAAIVLRISRNKTNCRTRKSGTQSLLIRGLQLNQALAGTRITPLKPKMRSHQNPEKQSGDKNQRLIEEGNVVGQPLFRL